jgi:WD40 repeat protein
VVSVVVLAVVFVADPRTPFDTPARDVPDPVAAERGDPALAADLAQQAQAQTDEVRSLRLLLAAWVVAPDRAGYRLAVAGSILDRVEPQRLNGGDLGGGSVRYGALSAGGAWLVIDRDGGGQLWQLRANAPVFRMTSAVDSPIVSASAGEMPVQTKVLVSHGGGVDLWELAPTPSRSTGRRTRITDPADAVGVSYRADTAVTVSGTTATVWELRTGGARAVSSLSYDHPVTSVDLPPTTDLHVAAAHADGAVTVDRIDLHNSTSVRQTLVGHSGPVAAATVSGNGKVAVAVGEDGELTVWLTAITDAAPSATLDPSGAVSTGLAGPYRLWLSSDGSFALVAGASAPPSVWSLADPTRPARLHELPVGADPAVPAMFTYDGRSLVTIDRANTVTVWDTTAVVDTLENPLVRACEATAMTESVWREIVADRAFANPCPAVPGLPTIDVQTGRP